MPSSDRAQLRCLISELMRKADRPVLVTSDGVVHAGELAARARARASDLTSLGASAGTAAALIIADRIDLVAAMLACLEAGVVFVPISPAEPTARLDHLVRASGARVVLRDDHGAEGLAELHGEPMTFADDACYVYFTSGTTGQPRPLLGRARSLDDFVDWELREFGIGAGDRCSQFIRPSFDAFLRDTLVPLCAGATSHLPPADPFSLEPRELWSWLRSQRVTVVHTVPTLLRRITDGADGPLPDLRCLLVSGEPLLGSDVERWQAAGNDPAIVVNLYGPTETTMIKLFHRVGPADAERQRVPVGKPIRGSQAYIADTGLRPVPPGTAGEVIIRTPFATAGYLDSERHGPGGFAPNPFTKDGTDLLYRTGDVGRQLADGDIELLGRMDDQLKVAGARIEPAEVEHALLRHDGVREAAVDAVGEPDARRLVAWVVASDGTAPADADVRLCAALHLPAELIPGQLVWLPALPVTSSGKVDRATLRTSYEQLATSRDDTAPATATEKSVHDIVTSVIGTEVGTHADFFAVGGTSLAATQVIARLRRKFGCDLGVRELFENPTIAGLARCVDQAAAIGARPEPVTLPTPSAAQRRIWFVNQLQPDDPAYTITAAAQVPGPLDVGALGRAASAVLRHREALRCAFTATDGELALSVTDQGPVAICAHELDDADDGLSELINAQARTVFPLHRGNLLRICVAQSDTAAPVVILSTHHIVADELSIWLLAADLLDAYNCELDDVAWQPERPADRGYASFALAQQEWAKSPASDRALSHWTELAAGIPALGIASGTGPGQHGGPGGTVRFDFGADTAAMLSSCAREMRVTLYNALTAALHIALSAMTGVTDVATTTSVDLRDSVELERSVGLFVNSVVMRSALAPGATFRDVACALRDQWARAQPHLRCPYDDVVAAIRPDQAPGRRILSEVNFDFHDRRYGDGPLGQAGAHALEIDHASAKFPVDVSVVHSGERLDGQLRFQRGRVASGAASELVTILVETARAAAADHDVTVQALVRGDDSLSSRLVNEFASGA